MSERIKVAAVCMITGMSRRQVQAMAKSGKIPSAAQLADGLWTFREDIVRRWVRSKEKRSWRGISTSAERPGGSASPWTAASVGKAYEQFMSVKRGNAPRS